MLFLLLFCFVLGFVFFAVKRGEIKRKCRGTLYSDVSALWLGRALFSFFIVPSVETDAAYVKQSLHFIS